jgi:hypothetical protein
MTARSSRHAKGARRRDVPTHPQPGVRAYCEITDTATTARPQRDAPRWTCPCCGLITLTTTGHYEQCPACRWTDDPLQMSHHDQMFGFNESSLRMAQQSHALDRLAEPFTGVDHNRNGYKADLRWRPLMDSDPQIAIGASAVVYKMLTRQPRYWLR